MPAATSKGRVPVAAAVAAAAALVAYANAVGNGATNFDDLWQVLSNPLVQPPFTVDKITGIFFAPYHGEYQPVKLLSYLLDEAVARALRVDPRRVLHLTNVVFHALNTALVALISIAAVRDMGAGELRERGTLFVGLFSGVYFALHPIHVESVAWISGRKDVLCFFFMAASLLAFRRAAVGGRTAAAALSVVLFALALASKATVLTFPLIVFVYWMLAGRRGGRTAVVAIFALALLAASYAVFGASVVAREGYSAGPSGGSYFVHLLTVVKTFPFYMRKMFFPEGLSAVYPTVAARGPFDPAVWWGAAMILAQLAMVVFIRVRMVRFIVLWYLLGLVPVLQIVPMPVPSISADRYAYVSSVPFALAAAVILWQVRRRLLERGAVAVASILVAAGVVYAGVLGAATWSRNRVWRSSETLWRDVIEKDPSSRFGLVNLGQYYLEAGYNVRSRDFFVGAVQSDPGFIMAYSNLALSYEKTGDLTEAKAYYQMALTRPSSLTERGTLDTRARAAYGLARIYFQERRYLTARRYAEDAMTLSPELAGPARFYAMVDGAIKESKALADEFIRTGDALAEAAPDKAINLYTKAADAALEYDEPVIRRANLYRRLGEHQSAFDDFALAAALGAHGAQFDYEYGVAALHLARYDAAAERLSMALAEEPSMEDASVKLAIAKAYLGEPAQALLILRDVLEKDPGNEEAKKNFDAIKSLVEQSPKGAGDAAK